MNMGGMTMQMQTPCDQCGGQGKVSVCIVKLVVGIKEMRCLSRK